ncbi:MAG: cytochrome bc complex cytochrome b subunit [Jiangellales bacterium]
MSATARIASKPVAALDSRLTIGKLAKDNLRKVFPDHWSFLLGEIALYSFIVLLLSGTFLTLFFKPSMVEVVYQGSYVPLRGVPMSEAYASTLDISFDVRGGLLMRQVHHWSALLFVASMTVHMFRVFFTGAFRRPREINWSIGGVLLLMGLAAGFTGYSLPDDLLSGTGLRIIEGIVLSIPVVGTYLSFMIFGGQYPGDDIISRLYIAHVLIVPGLILALVGAHLLILWYQKHTQWPGPGRTEQNVVGYPLFPVYTAKAGGFFFVVSGVIVLMSALIQINPLWFWGPYDPSQVTAGTQPDWYIGWLDGMLRVMPGWEFVIFGYTLSLNVLIPSVVMPGILTTILIAYPAIEKFATGDDREHHLLDRPRNNPTRTGIGVMAIVFYGMLWLSGGNDFVATIFQIPVNYITMFMQIGLFVLPPLAFVITRRIAIGLQRRDMERLTHGRETGVIRMTTEGEFYEEHEPVSEYEAYALTAQPRPALIEAQPAVDENGVKNPNHKKSKRQAALNRFYWNDTVQKPTADELHNELEHAAHDTEDHLEHEILPGGGHNPPEATRH